MQDLNQTVLIGRLTRNCELKFTQGETPYTYASIAVNNTRKDGNGNYVDDPSFFDVQIWGKTAQNLCQYLTKGKQICVLCHLKQDRWEKDGQKFSKVNIIADSVQLLGGNKNSESAPQFVPAPSSEIPSRDFPEDVTF